MPIQNAGRNCAQDVALCGFLISIFFIFVFTKIYFRYGNLQKYTPAAQLPGGRDLAARQPGGRGFSEKKHET